MTTYIFEVRKDTKREKHIVATSLEEAWRLVHEKNLDAHVIIFKGVKL